MKLVARIVLSSALLLAAGASWAQSAGRPQRCSNEIREVVTAALQYGLGDVPQDYAQDRIDLKSPVIPDYGILRHNGMIYIRDYLDAPECIVDESVLPRSATATFVLVDDEQIRELAQRNGEAVRYVRALEVRFLGEEAGIGLGVALRSAPGDARGLTCCCGGEMVLRRDTGRWRFVAWRNVFCA